MKFLKIMLEVLRKFIPGIPSKIPSGFLYELQDSSTSSRTPPSNISGIPPVTPSGIPADPSGIPPEDQYKTLMENLQSFIPEFLH